MVILVDTLLFDYEYLFSSGLQNRKTSMWSVLFSYFVILVLLSIFLFPSLFISTFSFIIILYPSDLLNSASYSAFILSPFILLILYAPIFIFFFFSFPIYIFLLALPSIFLLSPLSLYFPFFGFDLILLCFVF